MKTKKMSTAKLTIDIFLFCEYFNQNSVVDFYHLFLYLK